MCLAAPLLGSLEMNRLVLDGEIFLGPCQCLLCARFVKCVKLFPFAAFADYRKQARGNNCVWGGGKGKMCQINILLVQLEKVRLVFLLVSFDMQVYIIKLLHQRRETLP